MKIKLTLIAFALMVASCQPYIHGNGNIITDSRDVGSFYKIQSDIMSEVILVQDSSRNYVEVNGYENLVNIIDTHVAGGTLVIKIKQHFTISNNNTKITIHTPQVNEIELSGVGSFKAESFKFGHLKVDLSGAGSINLSGEANQLNLESSGAGSINTNEVTCDTVYARTSGVGSISCNALKYLNAEVSGVGSISYTGNPDVDKKVSGVGSVRKSD